MGFYLGLYEVSHYEFKTVFTMQTFQSGKQNR